MGAIQGVYAFEATTDQNGASIPAGWSVYGGGKYTSRDLAADGAGVEVTDSIRYSYLAKVFFDIEYETAFADVYRVRETVDLSAIPEGFAASSYDFQMMLDHTETQPILTIMTGTSEDKMTMYGYVETDEEYYGARLHAGWNALDPLTGEAAPYDMAARPLVFSLVNGAYEIPDMDAFRAVAEYKETKEQIMEALNGTVYFMLRA
jgi:hypothetical protein